MTAVSSLSSSSGERSETGGRSGAEGDLFTHAVSTASLRDSFALSRAAGFRVFAALRPE